MSLRSETEHRRLTDIFMDAAMPTIERLHALEMSQPFTPVKNEKGREISRVVNWSDEATVKRDAMLGELAKMRAKVFNLD